MSMWRNADARLRAVLGGLAFFTLLSGAGLAYASFGGLGRDRQVALLFIYVTIVVALQVFVGNSGVFSLGHIGIAGIAAYTAVILAADPVVKDISIPDAPGGLAAVQLHPVLAITAGVLVATLVAAVVGAAVVRLNGLAALIVTLAFLVVVNNVLTNWKSVTGGAEAFYGFPNITSMSASISAALVAFLVALWFRESAAGVRLQAAREDEVAAGATGVDVARSRFVAWVLSSALVSVGGALLAFFVGATNPREYFLHLTFLTLAMLVLGGMHSVMGAAIGAAVIFATTEFTRYLGDGPVLFGVQFPRLFGLSTLFLGAVILGVMLARPTGLVGNLEFHQVIERFRRRRGHPSPTGAVASNAPAVRSPRREATLSVRGVGKSFKGLRALDDVSLDVRGGEIVGLIGPNGAGKTTLINVITALVPATDGEVVLNDEPLTGLRPAEVAAHGVARTFQNIRLFGELTVRQNLEVAASKGGDGHREAAPTVPALLTAFGLDDVSERKAGTLAYGQQRQVEMARAAALAPHILLLDEPAAGMNNAETEVLLHRVRDLRDRLGCGVIVVDHDLHFILNLCDRIYVLNGGRMIAAGSPREIQRHPAVIAAYLGERGTNRPGLRRGASDARAPQTRPAVS
jgi:branched-chain amino acid transport system permease protein